MRSRQRGVAIVLAMSVVALAAMAAVGILVSQSTWARHSELASGHAQAQQLARAGIDWARAVPRLAEAPGLVCDSEALAHRVMRAFERPLPLPLLFAPLSPTPLSPVPHSQEVSLAQ